jgi:hypothetical protein
MFLVKFPPAEAAMMLPPSWTCWVRRLRRTCKYPAERTDREMMTATAVALTHSLLLLVPLDIASESMKG